MIYSSFQFNRRSVMQDGMLVKTSTISMQLADWKAWNWYLQERYQQRRADWKAKNPTHSYEGESA